MRCRYLYIPAYPAMYKIRSDRLVDLACGPWLDRLGMYDHDHEKHYPVYCSH